MWRSVRLREGHQRHRHRPAASLLRLGVEDWRSLELGSEIRGSRVRAKVE